MKNDRNNGGFYFRWGVILFLCLAAFLNSKSISDTQVIFSMEDLGFEENVLERVDKRTKYSGETIL